ncbi:MAG: hypothetical protein HS126_05245 [Anaerolineales bacterium]|nr:hypothetical protein [Anaerolineales bacterium]
MFGGVLADQPTVDDALGYQKASEALANIIIDENTDTPLTIGVFGEWGVGKTSFLKMIEERIPSEKYSTVWFDPWRYDEKQVIQAALIQTILAKIDQTTTDEGFRRQIIELSAKFLALIAAKVTEVATSGLVKPIELFNEAKQIIKPGFEEIRSWNEIDRTFERVVNIHVGKEGRLIIFIDDLDRCMPENAIQVLEAIKLFLAQKNCVFVLGVDKQGIENAISLRYRDNPQMSGVRYLEKIIQIPFFLPQPDPDNIKVFTQSFLGETTVYQTQRVISAGAVNNPRRIKRFINTLSLLRAIASDKDLEEPVLAKIVIIQSLFPEFFQILCNEPEAIRHLMELSKAEQPSESPKYNVYKKFLDKQELIAFLIKTRDINPRYDLWDSYLHLATIGGDSG